jgi:hypothetical protein
MGGRRPPQAATTLCRAPPAPCREALKNDLPKEMDVAARPAATEATMRNNAPCSPALMNNNNNNNTSGGGAMLIPYEHYCGPWSWIVGCCLFPCICFCPIDTRPVGVARM